MAQQLTDAQRASLVEQFGSGAMLKLCPFQLPAENPLRVAEAGGVTAKNILQDWPAARVVPWQFSDDENGRVATPPEPLMVTGLLLTFFIVTSCWGEV
jgi:hypothetical protein